MGFQAAKRAEMSFGFPDREAVGRAVIRWVGTK